MPKILTRLRIDEVSSVDRGAGEGVQIMLMKRQKEEPMTQPSTLSKIFAKMFGSDTNTAIIDQSVEGLAKSISSILADENVDHAVELGKTFDQFSDHLKSTLAAGPAVIKTEEPAMDLSLLKKALGLADTATEADVTAAITKSLAASTTLAASVSKMERELVIEKAQFTPAELDFYKASKLNDDDADDAKKAAAKAFRDAGHVERASIMKTAEPALPTHIQKIMDDNVALAKRLADLEAGGSLVTLAKQATDAGLPEAEATTIQLALSGNKEAVEKLLGFVKTANAAAVEGGVFKEFGTNRGGGVPNSAYDELVAKAEELRKTDPKLTQAAAFTKVYEDPANIAIVKRERGENRPN